MTPKAIRSSWLAEVTTFLAAWNSQAVPALFGPLHSDLRVSGAKLVWMAVAFDVAGATALRSGSSWSRRVGSRAVLAAGAAAFAAASAGCALASGWAWLVGLRALQGAAAAVALAAAFEHQTIVRRHLNGDLRDVRSGGLAAALAGGPLLAGAVAVHDWRPVMFFSDALVGAAVCGVALAAGGDWRCDRTVPARREPFDVAALIVVCAALAGSVGALAEVGAVGWGGAPALALLAVGLVALGPVLAWETPFGGRDRRAFAATQIADLCLFVSVSGVLLLLAGYFHAAEGVGPLGVGIRLLPWSAAVAVGMPLTASLDLRGMRAVTAAGLLLHAAALLAVAMVVHDGKSEIWVSVPLSFSGLGVSLALPAARYSAATVGGTRRPTGVLSGIGAVRLAGAGLGTALFASMSAAGGGVPGAPLVPGMVPAVAAAGVVAATGAAAALALPRLAPARSEPCRYLV